jgi:hypothetical protein
MADPKALEALRSVVATRELRKHLAAAQLARRTTALSDAQAREDIERAALSECQALWRASLQTSFDPNMVGAWAGAVLEGQAASDHARSARLGAQADLEVAARAQALANAHREAAGVLLTGAMRAQARQREETALAQVSDRTSQIWRRR